MKALARISKVVSLFIFCLMVGCSGKPKGPVASNDEDQHPGLSDSSPSVGRQQFATRTLAGDLNTPWDICLDAEGRLWITERGGTVTVVDTATGRANRVGQVSGVLQRSESGLMGMAFHPDFPAIPLVYFAHSYDGGGGAVRNRLIRMTFDGARLQAQETLINNIPGSFYHNGSRLLMGPDRLLYMSTGDADGPNLAIDLGFPGWENLALRLRGPCGTRQPFCDRSVFIWTPKSPGFGIFYHHKCALCNRAWSQRQRRGEHRSGRSEPRLARSTGILQR